MHNLIVVIIFYFLILATCSQGGAKRECGFWIPFIVGLFLTPLASLIIVGLSKKDPTKKGLNTGGLIEVPERKCKGESYYIGNPKEDRSFNPSKNESYVKRGGKTINDWYSENRDK